MLIKILGIIICALAVFGFLRLTIWRDKNHSYKSSSKDDKDIKFKKEIESKLRKLEEKLNKKNDLTETEKQKLTDEIKGLKQQLNNLDNPSNPNDKPVDPKDPPKNPPQNPPHTSIITEEEAKKKLLEEFSKLFKQTHETLENNLLHFAHRVNYWEEKKLSPKELAKKLKVEIEKNKKDLYSSLPKTSAEIQQGVEISNYRNSLIFAVFFLPRNDGGGIDWKKAWEKREEIKEREIDNSDDTKIESNLEEIKKIIEEEYNIELKNEAIRFSNINDLSEFNQWMNDYLNKITLGNYLLDIRDKIASKKLGKSYSHGLVKHETSNNQKLGIGMEIHTFSC